MTRQMLGIFEFGPFQIDVAKRLLLRDGEVVPLTPKSFEILLVLVENHGDITDKEVLMKLERGLATGAIGAFYKDEPVWDTIRGDPRFADLLRRMG